MIKECVYILQLLNVYVLLIYLENICKSMNCAGNLALRKPVWEDQRWKGKEDWRRDKAVEGLYDDRSALGGQCVISENFARTATWGVDLERVVSISYIDIYYRTDNKPRMITLFFVDWLMYAFC